MSRLWKSVWLAGLVLAAAAAWPAAAEDKPKESGGKPAAEKSDKRDAGKTDQPDAEKPAEKADPFVVPDGKPEELVEYIKGLTKAPPPDAEALKKTRQCILQAAEKILAGKPNDQDREFGVQAKMNMLDTPEQVADFAAALKKDGHEKLARLVRGFLLQGQLRKSITAGAEQMKKPIEEATKFLEEAPPQASDISLALMAGRMSEMSGDNELAAKTYGSLSKIFAASEDKRIAEFGKTLEGVVRRLTLLGNKMTVEGKIVGGEALDWPKYLGKVVLIDFWATWCGPCVAEIPNMTKCYELYRDKGFEIVGLSCDRNLDDLEKFLKEKKIPWTIVYGENGPSPTVAYYGIMGIPTMILVGKDGNVVSLGARGPQLRKELEKLLGPVEEKKEAKEGEEKGKEKEDKEPGKEEGKQKVQEEDHKEAAEK
jgi:thiol-disulfide isomerase/thioredoxin